MGGQKEKKATCFTATLGPSPSDCRGRLFSLRILCSPVTCCHLQLHIHGSVWGLGCNRMKKMINKRTRCFWKGKIYLFFSLQEELEAPLWLSLLCVWVPGCISPRLGSPLEPGPAPTFIQWERRAGCPYPIFLSRTTVLKVFWLWKIICNLGLFCILF